MKNKFLAVLIIVLGGIVGYLGGEIVKSIFRPKVDSAPTISVTYFVAPHGEGVVQAVVLDDDTCIVRVGVGGSLSTVAHSRAPLSVGDKVTLKRAMIYRDGVFYSEQYVARKKK